MRRLLLVFICLIALQSGDLRGAVPIKVMSFNLRFDATAGVAADQANAWMATSGKHRRDIALQVVRDFDPDLLCVQEALANQIEDLQTALKGHRFYGLGRDDGRKAGEYCGIFYRHDRLAVVDQGTFWLNEAPDQPGTRYPGTCCARIASWMILRDQADGDEELVLLNTHWDHQIQAARLFSAQLIRQRLSQLAGTRPIVIVGDLNVTTDNPAFRRLVGSTSSGALALSDSFRQVQAKPQENEATFHGFRGNAAGRRIDFVLHTDDFQTVAAQIVRSHQEGRFPSDHFPVTATIVPVE
jgi:endonuclease/exonuclease/phosphatase family metal-dependent hydrolase